MRAHLFTFRRREATLDGSRGFPSPGCELACSFVGKRRLNQFHKYPVFSSIHIEQGRVTRAALDVGSSHWGNIASGELFNRRFATTNRISNMFRGLKAPGYLQQPLRGRAPVPRPRTDRTPP